MPALCIKRSVLAVAGGLNGLARNETAVAAASAAIAVVVAAAAPAVATGAAYENTHTFPSQTSLAKVPGTPVHRAKASREGGSPCAVWRHGVL